MNRLELIEYIKKLASEKDFDNAAEDLKNLVCSFDNNPELFIQNFIRSAIIPELFDHDSTEEKLYAKYLDVLLAKFFELFGFNTEIVKRRGNEPDVIIKLSNNKKEAVGDAKGARFSRTAINPKDLKIDSLRGWASQHGAPYAILLFPLLHLPQESQIYNKLVEHKVLLITFEDIGIILKYFLINKVEIKQNDIVNLLNCEDIPSTINKYRDKYYRYLATKISNILNIDLKTYSEELEEIKTIMLEEKKLQQKLLTEQIKKQLEDIKKMKKFLDNINKTVREFLELGQEHIFNKRFNNYDDLISNLRE